MMMFSIVLLLILLLSANSLSSRNVGNRREAISKAVAFGAAGLLIQVQPSLAAEGAAPTTAELDRIRLGYNQITYLLDNFEQETTTCRENGGECKRDAEPIREFFVLKKKRRRNN